MKRQTVMIPLSTGATLDLYDSGGDRFPLVLVHGLLGTPERHFSRIIAWLEPHFRIIAPTLRGYGESLPKPRDFPHDFYQRDAADVLALLDALKVEKAHLLGYSDGGEAALCAATTAPERFESLAVWGAVGYFSAALRPMAQRLFPAHWISAEDLALHHIEHADAFILRWIKAFHRIIDSGGDLSRSQAHLLTMPVLLMLGDGDKLNPVADGAEIVARMPNGKLALFACGHAVHDEAWADFQRVVGAFLKI